MEIDRHVPKPLREGFFFHATDIWNKYRDYPEWTAEAKIAFIGAVAAIPRRVFAAVAVGKAFRTTTNYPGVAAADMDHLLALRGAMGRADEFIKDRGNPNEIGLFVCEDIASKRKLLLSSKHVIYPEMAHDETTLQLTRRERELRTVLQRRMARSIERIVDRIHFAEKHQAPLLQIADACAYSFFRFFARKRYGDDLINALLGSPLDFDDYTSALSFNIFRFHQRARYKVFGVGHAPHASGIRAHAYQRGGFLG